MGSPRRARHAGAIIFAFTARYAAGLVEGGGGAQMLVPAAGGDRLSGAPNGKGKAVSHGGRMCHRLSSGKVLQSHYGRA